MSYWDTACLVKLYTPEPNSAVFRAHLAASGVCQTCDIAPLEFWNTVRRKETEGALAPGEAERVYDELEADIHAGLILIQICDREVEKEFHDLIDRCFSAVPPVHIRTNDALHLAAARVAGETEIIATDKRMREAALLIGLTVFPAP